VAERLDEERLEILRSWGAGLSTDDREELRAAGKAILLLVKEIEHLQVEVWSARDGARSTGDRIEETDRAAADPGARPALATNLRDRIRAAITPAASERQQ
jgi:hypothetical protein